MDGVKRQVKANHNDFKKFHNLVYNKTYSVAKDISVQEDMPRTTSHFSNTEAILHMKQLKTITV